MKISPTTTKSGGRFGLLALAIGACAWFSAPSSQLRAQEKPAVAGENPDGKLDEAAPDKSTPADEDALSEQAADLEGELAKLRDNTSEAAELMLRLIDLYHGDGRALGLARVGEAFVARHPDHPRHAEAMLRLLDGLMAISRNHEAVATARQFLGRYPEAKECARVERTLAKAIDQLNTPVEAAPAWEAVWRRSPETPEGRKAALLAIQRYAAVASGPAFSQAATIGEALLDATPAGDFVTEIGLQAVEHRRRAGEFVKSNAAATKLLEKSPPKTPQLLSQLHQTVANNFAGLGQRANGAAAWKKAREALDNEYVHRSMIVDMFYGEAKIPDLEAAITEYLTKYPTRPERFGVRAFLAHALLRTPETTPRGQTILEELLPDDAISLNSAGAYLNSLPNEPEPNARAERTLLAALAKNPRDAAYLRMILGMSLYRDRLKDIPKAQQVARELISKTPSNDGYTAEPIKWLLYAAASDAEFRQDLDLILKARAEWAHWAGHREFLANWQREASQNNDFKLRAAEVENRLAAEPRKEWIADWIASESQDMNTARAARARLLAAELTDDQARLAYGAQAYSYRYQGPAEDRVTSATLYAQMAKRFPKDLSIATAYLETSTDFATPEAGKAAAAHMLTQTAEANNANVWYRLMLAADRASDVELAKRSLDWILDCQKSFGPDSGYAETIGDYLAKFQLIPEAVDYWNRGLTGNRDTYHSRACAERLLARLKPEERQAFIESLLVEHCDYHGTYAIWLAGDYFKAGALDAWEKTLRDSVARQALHATRLWGIEEYPVQQWVDATRDNALVSEADKRRVFQVVREMQIGRPSAAAALALLEMPAKRKIPAMTRLLAWQDQTMTVDDTYVDWDRLMPYAQAAIGRRDFVVGATLLTGMLSNIPNVDAPRLKAGRDMLALCYSRVGGVGLAIDESSPIAPLMQAALYLRLGDERLAMETYTANRALFDQHRAEIPIDLLLFVCQNHLAAGGDENHDRVEDILRSWLVALGEVKEVDDASKARVQLLLAKNYFKSLRYDVARSEYTTIINRFPNTPEAIEAEFGIGESYMAQKVYDQAEQIFEKLASGGERDTVARAEFLRGALASRRGDLDEARRIFRGVLERAPTVELANETLFNLSEVYGAEQRYVDQLELLRTVGRLGRLSQKWHSPGAPLSIVVQDGDLGVSRGHARIPVQVRTEPGGDEETIYLYSGGAGKGLFRADLETRLGQVIKRDNVLQLSGADTILCDYPLEFKAEFKSIALTDSRMKIASDGRLQAASGKIVDKEAESFTSRLKREEEERVGRDRRLSQGRPDYQIKPGAPIHLRVHDADRDLTDSADEVTVKLVANSGDQSRIALKETEPHSGLFEGVAPTGELPAGALASDTAIDHSPLMAIDRDPATFWLSAPDGAAMKWLSVDMKDMRRVDRVTFRSPDPVKHVPVRGALEASQDGRFWFTIASVPPLPAANLAEAYGPMTRRVFPGGYTHFTDWSQVAQLSSGGGANSTEKVDTLEWSVTGESEAAKQPHAVIWQGKFLQPRAGAARILVRGATTALALDGKLLLSPKYGHRQVDFWLEKGTHDLAIFAAANNGAEGASALLARADYNYDQPLLPFRRADFDLEDPLAKPALLIEPAQFTPAEGVWDFRFEPREARHVRLRIDEYLGEMVAISQVEVSGDEGSEPYIPTAEDVLGLAENDILEIAAGDTITVNYTDEFTQGGQGRGQLLTQRLDATYFNCAIQPIAYDFARDDNGGVYTVRKELMRIDPGERIVIEIIDYDMDLTAQPDTLEFQVAVNDGEPVRMTATETDSYTGVFTKEIDTSAGEETGKLTVKRGDRVYCTYLDAQNTFPGHAVPREAVVYVIEPSEARVRIVDSRVTRSGGEREPPAIEYLPPEADSATRASHVAFEAPLMVEVIDRDAARDSRSKVTVSLATTDGAMVDVECVISEFHLRSSLVGEGIDPLEEGRFVGQVSMQLGGKASPGLVPRPPGAATLIGGPKLSEKEAGAGGETLVTRVLNLTGKDIVTALYRDEQRPDGKPLDLRARGRLVANGALDCVDREYQLSVVQLHVGEKLFLRVLDPDLDASDERDRCKVQIASDRGEREVFDLEETLAHSGVFTGSLALVASEKPKAGDLAPSEPVIETFFGDTLQLTYVDVAAATETGKLELTKTIPVVVGTDGLLTSFSKVFGDENLAVETQFHIAESYFELFKSHKKLGRQDQQKADLEAGRRVLREVMEDYPNPKYAPRIAYLLGQFSQELENWDEAIESYRLIVRQFPDSPLAADAQYKLAQCHEDAGQFDQALEAYVTLAATYPKSPLVANVMLRISERFYKDENYEVAAQVGEKFLERFDGHPWAPKMAFRVGQCQYKAKKYAEGGSAFDRFAKRFPDDPLCADALFWSGECLRMAGNARDAFRRYNRCRWDFPSSDAAKYSRGRLALPAMLAQFEAEANAVEDEEETK